MAADDVLPWLAESLAMVMRTPLVGEQRAEAGRLVIAEFADRISLLSPDEQMRLVSVLDRWIRSGQIEGYALPADKESFAWMESLVGTMLGILES